MHTLRSLSLILCLTTLGWTGFAEDFVLENASVRYVISTNAMNVALIDRATDSAEKA